LGKSSGVHSHPHRQAGNGSKESRSSHCEFYSRGGSGLSSLRMSRRHAHDKLSLRIPPAGLQVVQAVRVRVS
jgi:hypothetical protein